MLALMPTAGALKHATGAAGTTAQGQLQEALRARGLDDGGVKPVLVDRLWAAVCAEQVRFPTLGYFSFIACSGFSTNETHRP